ncbi:MAG: hypothetical protein OCD02_22565 [Spirochaetaceae bacterium]
MKLLQIGLGLISLDRLIILQNRVLLTITDYRTLINSLDTAFSSNKLELIDTLELREKELLKILTQRMKIFKAHIKHLKTLPKKQVETIIKIETEVYTKIEDLNLTIDKFQKKLLADRIELKKEMAMVSKRVKPMGQGRDYTARRIDIIT